VLKADRHHPAGLGKLRHDLLVQPDVHFRRAIESASVAELLRQLFAGGGTDALVPRLSRPLIGCLGRRCVAVADGRTPKDELEESSMDDAKRAALISASDRCERIAAASINPTALLDELRNALAVLQAEEHASPPPPTRARPVLRVIEGGLSNV
jgi:hypothetical protein